MKKGYLSKITALCMVLFLAACTTSEKQVGFSDAGTLYNTLPQGNTLFFLGYSNRKMDRREEEALCLYRAALQAVQFIAVQGSFVLEKEEGRGINYGESVSIQFDDNPVPEIARMLKPVSHFRNDRGSMVVYAFENFQYPQFYLEVPVNKKPPEWINSPPDVPGFITGVGVAERRSRLSDSLEAADRAALGALIERISLEIQTNQIVYSSKYGVISSRRTSSRAEAEIRGFYICSRYIDKRYFYSLAVCPGRRQEE